MKPERLRNTLPNFTIFWSLLAFTFCGCSNDTRPPANHLHQLSTTDHLEVTNHYYAFGTNITGTDVSHLITAVGSAKKKTWGTNMDWTSPRIWDVKFCMGTNRLTDISICNGVFKLEGVEYSDGTGYVEKFWEKLEADRTR